MPVKVNGSFRGQICNKFCRLPVAVSPFLINSAARLSPRDIFTLLRILCTFYHNYFRGTYQRGRVSYKVPLSSWTRICSFVSDLLRALFRLLISLCFLQSRFPFGAQTTTNEHERRRREFVSVASITSISI